MKNIKVNNTKKGFTLVELLAVIVILAIIMLIVIPNVLDTLTRARRKAFIEYVTKVYTNTEKQLLSDQLNGLSSEACILYDIRDIGLPSNGDYKGYTVVVKDKNNNFRFFMTLYDKEYMISGLEYPNININSLENYKEGDHLSIATLLDKANCSSDDYAYAPNGKNKPTDIGNSTESNTIRNLVKENKLKLFDYIEYIPNETSYMPDINKTGCAEESECPQEALNPSESKLWKVFRINDDNTIEIIVDEPTLTKIYLNGMTGFINSVDVLQSVASKYVNPKYALSARSFGYYGQSPKIEDTSKMNEYHPYETIETYSYNEKFKNEMHGNKYEEYGGGDIYFFNDKQQENEACKAKFDTPYCRILHTERTFWTASRSYQNFGYKDSYMQVVCSPDGNCNNLSSGYFTNKEYRRPHILVEVSSDKSKKTYMTANYFVPIVTLKSSTKIISGEGQYDNPYKIN